MPRYRNTCDTRAMSPFSADRVIARLGFKSNSLFHPFRISFVHHEPFQPNEKNGTGPCRIIHVGLHSSIEGAGGL